MSVYFILQAFVTYLKLLYRNELVNKWFRSPVVRMFLRTRVFVNHVKRLNEINRSKPFHSWKVLAPSLNYSLHGFTTSLHSQITRTMLTLIYIKISHELLTFITNNITTDSISVINNFETQLFGTEATTAFGLSADSPAQLLSGLSISNEQG